MGFLGVIGAVIGAIMAFIGVVIILYVGSCIYLSIIGSVMEEIPPIAIDSFGPLAMLSVALIIIGVCMVVAGFGGD